MATKEERVDIHRRFRVEWEKNWWARYALSLRKRDGTLEDHAEEDLCAWQNRDWDECNRFTILERLYLMPESEREATNQLCGRVDGNVLIEHTMGVRWAESRAQKRDHKDLDTFFPTEEYRQLAKLPKFPYGMEPFTAVSDLDYVKLWGGLAGFMLAFGIDPNDTDAVLRAGQLITALRKQGAVFTHPQVDFKEESHPQVDPKEE